MNIPGLDQIFQLLATYRYFLLFPVAIAEGPIITVITGYLSYLGLLNFLLGYFIMVLGDLAGDIIYYSLGRWGRFGVIEKYGHYFGITEEKVLNMEKLVISQGPKALVGGKLVMGVGGLIILATGAAKMKFKKFILYSTIGTLPKTFLLMLLGYYFGQAYNKIGKIFDLTAIASFLVVGIIIAVYYYTQKYFDRNIFKRNK